MFKTIKDYFKYNPEQLHLGLGGLFTFAWLNNADKFENFWFLLIFLIYFAYCGNRKIIILATIGFVAFAIYAYFHYLPNKYERSANNDRMIYTSVLFFRDMYFLYRYRINAFTYTATNEEGIERGKRIFLNGLVWIFIINFAMYGVVCWATYK